MSKFVPPLQETLLDEIETAARQQRLAFFFGAGISVYSPSCCPTWRQMVTAILRNVARDFQEDAITPHMQLLFNEVYLQQMDCILGRDWTVEAVRACLDAAQFNPLHRCAAWLLKHEHAEVLTSNFDELIELAWKQYDTSDLHALDRFVKLHGTLSQADQSRFTVDSVFEPLPDAIADRVRQSLQNRTLVVGGYSGMDEFDIMPAIVEPSLNCRTLWIHFEPAFDPTVRRHYRPLRDDQLTACQADIAEVLRALYRRLRTSATADSALDDWQFPELQPRDHKWYQRRIDNWGMRARKVMQPALDYLWAKLLDHLSLYSVGERKRNLAAEAFSCMVNTECPLSWRLDAQTRIHYAQRTLGEEVSSRLSLVVAESATAWRNCTCDEEKRDLIAVYGWALHQHAAALQAEKKFDEARHAFQQAIEFRRLHQDSQLPYSVFGLFMNACRAEEVGAGSVDEFAEPDWRNHLAEWLLERANEFRQNNAVQDFAQTLHNSAFVLQRQATEHELAANYEDASHLIHQAIVRYEQASRIRDRLRDPRMIAQSHIRIAQCRLMLSRLRQWQGRLHKARVRLDDASLYCRTVRAVYRSIPQEEYRIEHMKEVREQILFDRRHLLGNDLEQWRPSQPISNRENFDQEAMKLADRFGWKLGALIAVFDADLEQVCTVQLGDYAKARFGFHPWVLPGGSVDPGEAPSNAAIREFQEETGLALIPQVVPAGWFPRTYFKPHDRETIGELLLLFAATVETPLTPTQSSLEIRAVRWRRVNELRNDTVQTEGGDCLLVPHMLWCLAARGVLKHRLHPLLYAYRKADETRQPPWHNRRRCQFTLDSEDVGLELLTSPLTDEVLTERVK